MMTSDQQQDRVTHDVMNPSDWLDVLERGKAVYFYIVADHEWWMAYDERSYQADGLDGPWHLWSTYPRGAWDHSALPRGILLQNLENLYWMHDDIDRDNDVRRSKVVSITDAPEFVQNEVWRDG